MDITTIKERHHSLFNELMSPTDERQSSRNGTSSERRRVTLHSPGSSFDHPFSLSVPKAFSNTIGSELKLSDQVAAYNNRQSKQFHIRLQEDVSSQIISSYIIYRLLLTSGVSEHACLYKEDIE